MGRHVSIILHKAELAGRIFMALETLTLALHLAEGMASLQTRLVQMIVGAAQHEDLNSHLIQSEF